MGLKQFLKDCRDEDRENIREYKTTHRGWKLNPLWKASQRYNDCLMWGTFILYLIILVIALYKGVWNLGVKLFLGVLGIIYLIYITKWVIRKIKQR